MSNKAAEIRFGGEQVEFLSITVRGRAYRHSQDYWDGNWLLVTVVVHAGKFTGDVPGLMRAEEFQKFSGELRAFQQTLAGAVTFETTEEWLSLRFEVNRLGEIEIAGSLSDEVNFPYNTLKFTLKSDQSFLTKALQQLEQVVKAFPVIGKP